MYVVTVKQLVIKLTFKENIENFTKILSIIGQNKKLPQRIIGEKMENRCISTSGAVLNVVKVGGLEKLRDQDTDSAVQGEKKFCR